MQTLFKYDSFLICRNIVILFFLSHWILGFPTLIIWSNSCQSHFVWFQLCHVHLKIICPHLISSLFSTLVPVICLLLTYVCMFLLSALIYYSSQESLDVISHSDLNHCCLANTQAALVSSLVQHRQSVLC